MKYSSNLMLVLFTCIFFQSYSQAMRKRIYLPTIYEDEKLDLSIGNKRFIAQKVQEERRRLHVLASCQEKNARMNSVIARNKRLYREKKPARDCCGWISHVCVLVLSYVDRFIQDDDQ